MPSSSERGGRPHIVIVNPDEWRGDALGHAGHPAVSTPNLDRLVADEAVSFRSAFVQSPVCTPSRCSLMSGWYPHVRGHRTLHHLMQPDEPVLLRTLMESGYFVWWGGKNDLVPPSAGYDAYCDVRYATPPEVRPIFAMDREAEWRGAAESDAYYSFYVGELDTPDGEPYFDQDWADVMGAIAQIREWGVRAQHDPELPPLCIYLALRYPHPPYAVERQWLDTVNRDAMPARIREHGSNKPAMLGGIRDRQNLSSWPEERWDRLRATYYGMCARVDHQFGLLMQALRDAGLYDDTAVFLYSDHGDFTGDYGLVEKTQNTFEDCLTRVPFVVKPARDFPVVPGVRDCLVEMIDFYATVEDLASLTSGHTHFGRSLVPLMAGATSEHRDAVFCEGGRLDGELQAMERESVPGQSPTGLYWPRLSLQSGSGLEHGKATMCRTHDYKYVRRLYERDELYDLRSDPGELVNVIDVQEHASALAALQDRMLTWYQETADAVPLGTDARD